MDDQRDQKAANTPEDKVTFLALGGEEDVTRNMYLYEYKDQILIVDCGLGFPDETMLGVDLLLPDISYLLTTKKKIVGMVLTHGHEDHIGGLPFILPQLPNFPIYASPLTTALANEKLNEFKLPRSISMVNFSDKEVRMGDFTVSFIRVTHSVPDSANIFIKTPGGNFFHGSDFKFDLTPADGKRTEFEKIARAADEGILCLMSDCLGSDRSGFTASEESLGMSFEREMRECSGKFIITTYSSNISRLNQAIQAAQKLGRKVCFIGRSILKVKQIGEQLGYLSLKPGMEVQVNELPGYKPSQLLLFVAGSQGQENSAMTRIANGEHNDIKIEPNDVVVFSSDTIPGNEIAVNALIDTLSKKGVRVIGSDGSGMYHVSGHGSTGDHMLLIALTRPKYLLPISGTYRHMVAYKNSALKMGFSKQNIALVENGQSVQFSKQSLRMGSRYTIKNVYVDEVSGEEVEHFVIRDRERLGKEGVVIVLAEVQATDGQLADAPEIIVRGSSLTDIKEVSKNLKAEIAKALGTRTEKVTNWAHIRKLISEVVGKHLYRKFRTQPLILPVVIEV